MNWKSTLLEKIEFNYLMCEVILLFLSVELMMYVCFYVQYTPK